MTGRALLSIRRDDGDFTQRLRRRHETLEAVGENTIVIGGKEPHSLTLARRVVVEHVDELAQFGLDQFEGLDTQRAARRELQIQRLLVIVDFLSGALDRVLLGVQQMLHQHDQVDFAPLIHAIA